MCKLFLYVKNHLYFVNHLVVLEHIENLQILDAQKCAHFCCAQNTTYFLPYITYGILTYKHYCLTLATLHNL